MKKRLPLIASFIFAAATGFSQQELQLSTYFFNPLVINPAYAGSQKTQVFNAVVRDQWTNFKGAPKTQLLTFHTPLRGESMGLGFTLINDQIGAHNNKSFTVDYSLSVRLNRKNHRLALGLKAGLDVYQTNFSNSRIQDNSENVYLDGYNYTKLLPNVGAGLYYYGSKFYLGVSSPKIVRNNFNLPGGQLAQQENHFYAFGGYVFELNSLVTMRPSFMVKYVHNAPLSVDGNLSFLILNKFWIGAMYRYQSAVGANALYNITDQLSIGYAYDYSLSRIQRYSAGSHEIMLSYKIKNKSKGFTSPRYF